VERPDDDQRVGSGQAADRKTEPGGKEEGRGLQGVQGKGVRLSREIRLGLGRKEMSFGIWAKGSPTWAWYVGNAGSVEWMVGGSDLPFRNVRDTPHQDAKSTKWSELGKVDVVLCQDFRPGKQHEVWTCESVHAVVWCNRGLRGKERMPKGWTLTTKRLEHEKAGGVTNAVATQFT
jgi:hypothetical protein